MVENDEEKFFENADKPKDYEVTPDGIIHPELLSEIKGLKDEINMTYSKLINNPYLAPDLVDDAKSTLLRTIAVLMEHNIPLQHPDRIRTADDIIRESLAELGGMLGAKGAVAALRAKRSFQKTWQEYRESEDFEIFQDPETEDYYFIDPDNGEEIDCDEFGNPLEG